jgi:hypothetical protein
MGATAAGDAAGESEEREVKLAVPDGLDGAREVST